MEKSNKGARRDQTQVHPVVFVFGLFSLKITTSLLRYRYLIENSGIGFGLHANYAVVD